MDAHVIVLLLFLTFSALVANPKKTTLPVANPARGLLNREKKKKKKSGSAPPPRAARSENFFFLENHAGGTEILQYVCPSPSYGTEKVFLFFF